MKSQMKTKRQSSKLRKNVQKSNEYVQFNFIFSPMYIYVYCVHTYIYVYVYVCMYIVY